MKNMEKNKLKCEMIWKIWKKCKSNEIVKRYGKYRKKLYGRNS